MAENDQQRSDQEPKDEDLEFIVMPQGEGLAVGNSLPSKAEPGARSKPSFKVWLVLLVLLLVLLGGLVYWRYPDVLERLNFGKQGPASLPELSLPAGEEERVDSDKDGLTDKEEFDLALNPQKADSDDDGLADSDEIKIYGSDPLLLDTDNDGFDDGREVALGYSPVSPSPEKAGAEELQLWTERIRVQGLHEPTKTTLALKSFDSDQPESAYVNSQYGYRLVLPAALTYREAQGQGLVGFYVAGTTPADSDPATDPISINVAVKTGSQTLEDWLKDFHQPADYGKAENLAVNNLQAIRLRGLKTETCPQDKTFFLRPEQSGTVIVLTWTCNENTAYSPIYEQIITSFEFVQ